MQAYYVLSDPFLCKKSHTATLERSSSAYPVLCVRSDQPGIAAVQAYLQGMAAMAGYGMASQVADLV